MKESIRNNRSNKDVPLKFKCKCGHVFISNEYSAGMMLPSNGVYPSATDICPSCGTSVVRGTVYRPLINSEEYKKWYE